MRSFRAVLTVLGHPVGRRAAALYLAIGLPCAVIFGPRGMNARDLTNGMHASLVLRSFVWLGWLLLSAPAMGALAGAPGLRTLRSLRPARREVVRALLLLAAMVQLPWLVLHARGEGALGALAAGTVAIALGTRQLFALPLLGLALANAPTPLLALAGVIAASIALERTWRRPPIERERSGGPLRARAPLVALAWMHLLRLARLAPSRLGASALVSLVGGAGLLTLRGEPMPVRRALAIVALPSVLGAALALDPVLASERSAVGVLRSLRVPRAIVLGAFLLAVVTPSTALAATSSVIACSIATPAVIAWSAGLGALIGLWGRRFAVRSSLFALGVLVVGLVASFGVLP